MAVFRAGVRDNRYHSVSYLCFIAESQNRPDWPFYLCPAVLPDLRLRFYALARRNEVTGSL